METQSKKIDETKAKDRKMVFNLFFKRFALYLDFCCFLILYFHCILWDHFLVKFKRIAFEFNFYERNAFQCNRIRCGS